MGEQLELFPDLTSGEAELWDFARWILVQAREDFLDAIDIQNMAQSLGLIREVPYDPAKHGKHEWYEPGDSWMEFAGPLVERPT